MTFAVVGEAARSQHAAFESSVGAGSSNISARLAAKREYYARLLKEEPETYKRLQDQLWEDFLCFHQCLECGYLGDGQGHCPSCNQNDWIDLNHFGNARYLQDQKEDEQKQIPPKFNTYILICCFVIIGIVAFVTKFVMHIQYWKKMSLNDFVLNFIVYSTLLTTVMIIISVFVYYIIKHPLRLIYLRLQKERPHRWLRPLPKPNPKSAISEKLFGILKLVEDRKLLRAPFSGRSCLAYRVGLLVTKELGRSEWVLDECMATDIQINDQEIEGSTIYVELPWEEIEPHNLAYYSKEELAIAMRERGFFIESMEYRFFESIIEPGEEAWIVSYKKPSPNVKVLYNQEIYNQNKKFKRPLLAKPA